MEEVKKAGRPRMTEEEKLEKKSNFTHMMFGTHKNKDGKWCVSSVEYDPTTGVFSNKMTEQVVEDRMEAQYYFKINSAQNLEAF